MKVLIVSKTHMKTGVCVGGITPEGRFVRLLDSFGHNQPNDCPFKIKELYEITFKEKQSLIPPHTEDILVENFKFLGRLKDHIRMIDYITSIKANICKGNIDNLFDKSLNFTTNGNGYINSSKVPQQSVSFWIADKDLIKYIDSDENVRYKYQPDDPWSPEIQIKYVGLQPIEDTIPKGTLLRVSLARWWAPDNIEIEKRCYLQLSGWYK